MSGFVYQQKYPVLNGIGYFHLKRFKMNELSGFAPRDAKVIRENEGKSIYELLQLGISQKAGDRLAEMGYGSDSKKSEVEIIVDPKAPMRDPGHSSEYKPLAATTDSNIVKPASVKQASKVQVTSPKEYKQQRIASKAGTVTVLNKRTGGKIQMSASSAQRLLKQPHLYTIVQ